MRLFGKVNGKIDGKDRAGILTPPFDRSFVRTIMWNTTTNVIPALTPPTITPSALVSTGSATVTMTCDVVGATIRYSLNGRDSTPNFSSHVYTGPFTVYGPTVIHACWYFHGLKSRTAKSHVNVLR